MTNNLIPLHWCCNAIPHSGTALYTKWISAQPTHMETAQHCFKPSTREHLQDNCTPCLTSPLPSKWIYFIFIIMLMSVCHSRRSLSPLKTVFGKIGDTCRAYCTCTKHAMATHHGGSGQPLDRDINAHETIEPEFEHAQEFHPINTNDFEDSETSNATRLTAITRELDNLCQWVQAGEGQPSEALNHIEHKLQRLSISLHPSAPPEPLEEVLKHYTDTLCSAQKQTKFTTSLLQDILIFTGHDTTLLEDWLKDIETTTDLNIGKQDQTFTSKIKGFTMYLNYRSHYIWEILGQYQGFIMIENM